MRMCRLGLRKLQHPCKIYLRGCLYGGGSTLLVGIEPSLPRFSTFIFQIREFFHNEFLPTISTCKNRIEPERGGAERGETRESIC